MVVPLARGGVRRRLRAGLDADARRAAAGRARGGDRRLRRAGVLRSVRRRQPGGRRRRAAPARPVHRARRRRRPRPPRWRALGVAHAVYFPFDGAEPLIPFQRLGRAAGLGGPGPLGLQIHPVFGPWWAYRALVVVDRALPPRPPIGDGCAGCDAPCVAACPAQRGRARRLRRRRLSRAPPDRGAVPAVVRGADRLRARPGTSLHRRAARLSHGGVDAETLAARLTAHYSRSPWLR